ncbi:glycosyl hydrolase family 28-related protein [Halalkalibaculum sp. DA3122]
MIYADPGIHAEIQTSKYKVDTTTSRDLWRQYKQNPNTHSHIPNVSYAGYYNSEKPLIAPEVVADVGDFGAAGNGKRDDIDVFRSAIRAAAGKGGGTVHIPPGTYRLTGVIYLHQDGVVLAGSGQDKTTLLFDASLTEVLGANRSGSGHASAWSWMGGMIWIGPEDTFNGKKRSYNSESWRTAKTLTGLAKPASRGDKVVYVENSSGLQAADFVLMAWSNPVDLSLLLEMAGRPKMKNYDWKKSGARLIQKQEWFWPVVIDSVEGKRVTLNQPLRIDALERWDVQIKTPGPHVHDAGIENLKISFKNAHPVREHLEDVGNNGIYINRALNCYVRNVKIRNAENGLIHASAKQTTVSGIHIEGTRMHHATALRVSSHDNLISDFRIEAEVHHGINTEALSTGNVWRKGRMDHGTFDSHRAMSWGLLRTDITIHNDGNPGGASDTGPFLGQRVVHWNIRITNGNPDWIYQPEAISMGALVGIRGAPVTEEPAWAMPEGDKGYLIADPGQVPEPTDLFEAQFKHRTGRPLNINLNEK